MNPPPDLIPSRRFALRGDLINLAQREGITIILNTHNLAEAEKLCNTIGIIRQGKLSAYGQY